MQYFHDIGLYNFIKKLFSVFLLLLALLRDCFGFGSIALPVTVTDGPFVLGEARWHHVRGRARSAPAGAEEAFLPDPDLCPRSLRYSLMVLSINGYFICTKYSLLSKNPDRFLRSMANVCVWTPGQLSNSVISEPSQCSALLIYQQTTLPVSLSS